MIKNYLKTAFRNLKRNKSYTLINVLGLAVGIAACLLIFLVIRYETSFDNFHPKKKNIYRVVSEFYTQDGMEHEGGTSFPVAPAIALDFPQIKEVVRIYRSGNDQVTVPSDGTKAPAKFNEGSFYYTEPEFFKMFNFPWIAGSPAVSLKDPNSAALTQKTAEKYFGDWHQAIGKTIQRNNRETYKITGIIKDVPVNSDFPLTIVASFSSLMNTNLKANLDDWVSTYGDACTFVVLPDDYPEAKFNRDLLAFVKRHKSADYVKDQYKAQSLSRIHYEEAYRNFSHRTFSKSLITALGLIGIFLIIIACVNFVNLATAQAVIRSKEVGVRKVLGSNRRQLGFQFLSEAGLITITALFVAVVIAEAVLPFLNRLLRVQITMSFFETPLLLLFLLGVFIVVTLLSGLYPAVVLSGFNAINALKSKITSKMIGGISLRRGLVVFQFGIAHILIIGTLIVVSQMNFFRNATLGFDKAQIMNVNIPGDSLANEKMNVLKNKLAENPSITQVSFSFASPSSPGNWSTDFRFDNATNRTNFSANLKWADPDYFKTYSLKLVAGRSYYPSDTTREFVVNETLLKKLGITDPNKAIGKTISLWDGEIVAPIVGVVRDFNSYSLKEPMAPVILTTRKDVYQTANIKFRSDQEKAVLAFVEKLWNETFPQYVFQHSFLDETIRNFYRQEDQLAQLYKIFAGIAIFISCLGLYGLVSFMAVQRTKEVGIRKVLGASTANIVYLLSKEFSLLILIAFIIAGPIAYLIMHKWLQNYSYRVDLGATVFILAIIVSMIIAWVTAGHRALKAAVVNPVKSLRAE